ncbi:Protein kinase-like domain [Pseudocohnilembus persalinus]|uniref:Protein kinase-like domain n=1 Tax=Pseudocohnilembus persalinus TaxID=266149 RepID=A0A0V0QHS9_PSEPJ|nr:Protein kinase-like domain [Pseudocohnilembus persalinus]|eukprot:KRX01817.1 Protein kinase-like domain [Pseudocohnilembus persalinus]
MQGARRFVCLDKKYQFNYDQRLGGGSCGQVYLGCYYQSGQNSKQKKNKFFAIKEIPLDQKFEATDSLVQEINVLRRLKSTNIVQFIDAKKTSKSMYLIMEFCTGGTLEEYIEKEKNKITQSMIIKFMGQIVDGFKELYKNNILHRDVKPANILLQDGVCKLADFGMAKIIDYRKAQNMTYKGTPQFIAPQIMLREHYSSKSDVWSLGIVLYFMIFKEYPWNADNPMTLLNIIKKKTEPQNLIPKDANIDPDLQDLLIRMLKFEEKDRISFEELFDHQLFNKYKQNKINQSEIRNRIDTIYQEKKSASYKHNLKKTYEIEEDEEQERDQQNEDQDQDPDQVQVSDSDSEENQDAVDLAPLTKKSIECEIGVQDIDPIQISQNQFDMAKTEYMVAKTYQKLNEESSNCQKCLDILQNELEKACFLKDCFQELRQCYELLKDRKNEKGEQILRKDLYIKCAYLLLKRAFIIVYDLLDIVSFRQNTYQESLDIPQNYWNSLIKTTKKKFLVKLESINELIQKEKDSIYRLYQEQVAIFQDDQRHEQVFELIDRGDAYNPNTLRESTNLILAFNDNFTVLLNIFTIEIEKTVKKNKQQGLTLSKQQLEQQVKIDIYFVYDIILILSFKNLTQIQLRSQNQNQNYTSSYNNPSAFSRKSQVQTDNKNLINFEKYKEDRRQVNFIELLYRISKVNAFWQHQRKNLQQKQ